MKRTVSGILMGLVLVCGLLAQPGFAVAPQEIRAAAAPQVEARIAALEQQVTDARSAGDNAWMLVCAALVLMMTGPGSALFYGRIGAQEECAGHHDAELYSHGGGDSSMGILRLQPGVSRRQTASSGTSVTCFCTEWAPRPTRITREPYRSKHLWCINLCSPSSPRR